MDSKIKLLSMEEELDIINRISNGEFGGYGDNGASRVVYFPKDGALSFLGITRPCVIKVAVGVGGMNQLNAEVETYINYRDNYQLANIYAYGQYVEIMEKVKPVYAFRSSYVTDWDGNPECIEEFAINEFFCEDSTDEEKEEWRKVAESGFHAAALLKEVFGETSDNGQLGRRYDENGNLTTEMVAFDYGFYCYSDDVQTSDIEDCMSFDDYIIELRKLIEGHYNSMEELEEEVCQNGDYETYSVILRTRNGSYITSYEYGCDKENAVSYYNEMVADAKNGKENEDGEVWTVELECRLYDRYDDCYDSYIDLEWHREMFNSTIVYEDYDGSTREEYYERDHDNYGARRYEIIINDCRNGLYPNVKCVRRKYEQFINDVRKETGCQNWCRPAGEPYVNYELVYYGKDTGLPFINNVFGAQNLTNAIESYEWAEKNVKQNWWNWSKYILLRAICYKEGKIEKVVVIKESGKPEEVDKAAEM